MSVYPLALKRLRIWFRTVQTACAHSSVSPLALSGKYFTSTSKTRVLIEMIGASEKNRENTFVFSVADEIMTFSSGRVEIICFKRPRMKSMFRLRSWASSTMMTL